MIEYHFEADTPSFNISEYTNWISKVIEGKGKAPGDLSYIFCSDEYLWEINRKYLGHDYYTDIITFPSKPSEAVSGELYISIDRVRENAKEYNTDELEELRRVMIHGVLHLLGMSDESAELKEVMRREEDKALELFHVKH